MVPVTVAGDPAESVTDQLYSPVTLVPLLTVALNQTSFVKPPLIVKTLPELYVVA
jgi:hypothetical protein